MNGGYSDSWIPCPAIAFGRRRMYSEFFISLSIIHKKRAIYEASSYIWRFPLVKSKGLVCKNQKGPPISGYQYLPETGGPNGLIQIIKGIVYHPHVR
jgi:hypothetical protein